MIDPKNYSSLRRLLKVTATCMRFISVCRGQLFKEMDLSADEIDNAVKIWIKQLQIDVKRNPGRSRR